MTLALDHWHIELSSICALKCPRCPRAEVPDSLLNRQLTLEFFHSRFRSEHAKHIQRVTFCGNDGDPIYCRDFVDICTWFKAVNPDVSLVIVTNGSYRNVDFWGHMGRILDHRDEIHWSIDGWDQASNYMYRRDCHWPSIMGGIGAFQSTNRGRTYKIWDAIAFRFNQDYLDYMANMARDLGFDAFQITKSTKFGSHYPDAYGTDDDLEPTRPDLVATGHRYQRSIETFTARQRPGSELRKIFWQRASDLRATDKSNLCAIGNKGVFLNSQGNFYPCCWTAARYDHNREWIKRAQEQFNLWTRSLTDILADPFWVTDFEKFESQECRTKCTRERLDDDEHVTEW